MKKPSSKIINYFMKVYGDKNGQILWPAVAGSAIAIFIGLVFLPYLNFFS